MAMLGDEELTLRGLKPKFEREQDKKIKLFGYWTDERGIRHKGIIPEKQSARPISNWRVESFRSINGRSSTPTH